MKIEWNCYNTSQLKKKSWHADSFGRGIVQQTCHYLSMTQYALDLTYLHDIPKKINDTPLSHKQRRLRHCILLFLFSWWAITNSRCSYRSACNWIFSPLPNLLTVMCIPQFCLYFTALVPHRRATYLQFAVHSNTTTLVLCFTEKNHQYIKKYNDKHRAYLSCIYFKNRCGKKL